MIRIALIIVTLLVVWYEGYKEGWRQANEAVEAAAVAEPQGTQEQTCQPAQPRLEDRDWLRPPSGSEQRATVRGPVSVAALGPYHDAAFR